jgi:DNA invertase Pin-like site-specific DNA recombinase
MKGIIYCRVSSKEQIDGTSLESQQAACREYAQSKNIEVLKVFIEQGESAKFADRTQLLELIDFCRKNKGAVNVLLVWKVDRFARNVADHFSVKATLGKYGVRIVSVTEPIDANPEGKLMETILAGFAQFDNDIRAMRSVQGMRRKIQEGIFPWGPPFGYKSSVVAKEKKTMPDLPDEPAFSLIKRAFSEFATGAHTQSAMGRLMASWGLSSPNGKSFAPQSLRQLFTNLFYAGILVDPWTGEEHVGKHVPAVSREDFARVQRVLSTRNRSLAHEKYREEFPLRGLARCNGCGHKLTGAFSRGRSGSYPYYLCLRRQCSKRGKSLPAAGVHREFTAFLGEIAPRPPLIKKISDTVIDIVKEETEGRLAQRQQRRQRITQVHAQITELIDMRAQHLITNEEFIERKEALTAQRLALEIQEHQSTDSARVQANLERIMRPLSDLQDTWSALPPNLRARFGRLMLPGGFLVGKTRTADLGLLFSVFRASATATSSEVPLACVPSNPIISEIQAFSEVLNGSVEPEPEKPWRFRHSHRKRTPYEKFEPKVP